MIPDALREFLSAPRWCALGAVDERGRPHLTRCVGWQLGAPGGADLLVFAPTKFLSVRPGRDASERVALLMNESERFVAYQLKGRGKTREATAAEVQAAHDMMGSLAITTEQHWGLPASLYTSITLEPMSTIEVTVEEAFAQSPGPGAGQRIGGAP
jgi:predicted pyridoxine 5'-phosphate oxidase superfamily flavin-nucleotide-binding protein